MPNIELRGYEVLTHKPGNGAYRAPGAVQGTFAIESVMDEVARAGARPLICGSGTPRAPATRW